MAAEEIQGVKAVFSGDTSGLLAAYQKIEVGAKKLESLTGKAFGSLDKSVRKFTDALKGSGAAEKLQAIELAVQRMGGVANLTAPQLGRLRAELEKLERAGAKLPATLKLPQLPAGAGIRGLDKALQTAGLGQVQGLTGQLGGLGSALTALGPAGIAAGAAIGGLGLAISSTLGAAVELGSSISDLAAKTGLSTDAVQSFGYAAEQTGASVEDVARAAVILQKNIAGGAAVFQKLGLELAELRALSPDEQFLAVAEAIRQVEDPARQTQLALEAFGRRGAELLPAIRQGFSELSAEAREFGLVLGKDAVEAGERFGDAAARASKAWQNLKATVGGKIITTLQLDVVLNTLAKAAAGKTPGALGTGFAAQLISDLVELPAGAQQKFEADLAKRATSGFEGLAAGKGLPTGLPAGIEEQVKLLGQGLQLERSLTAERLKAAEVAKKLADAEAERVKTLKEIVAIGQFRAKQAVAKDIEGQFRDLDKALVGGGGVFGLVSKAEEERVREAQERIKAGQEALEAGQRSVTEATFDWSRALNDVRNAMDVLGISADSALGRIIGGLGQALAASQALKDALKSGATFQSRLGAGLQGLATLGSAFKNKSIFGGALQGAALGSSFGPLGAAIGAGAGALAGVFGKIFGGKSEAQKAAERAGKILGRTISEEMGKEILRRAKETGKSVEQVAKEIKVEELTAQLGELRGRAQEAVGKIASGLAFFGKIKGAAAAQGRIFGLQFAAVVKAEGFDRALELFKDAFSRLPEEVKAAVPAEIAQLFALAENEAFKAAVEGASALADSFRGTVELVGLSSQTMADFGAVAKATFDEAVAGAIEAGATQEQAQRAALQAVIPLLSQMQSAAIQTGVALDANTQALIDQAKAAGIEIPVDPLIQVVDLLKEIADTLREIGGIEVKPKVEVQTSTTSAPGATGTAGAGPPERGAQRGGLFSGPRKGYPVLLHGDEAVVPLGSREDMLRVLRLVARKVKLPGFQGGGFVEPAAAVASVLGELAGGGARASGSGGLTIGSIAIAPNITVEGGGDPEAIGAAVAEAIRQEIPSLTAELEGLTRRRLGP